MHEIKIKLIRLQKIIKLYLMVTGSAQRLGDVSLKLVDVLLAVVESKKSVAEQDLDALSVQIIKVMCISTIEALEIIGANDIEAQKELSRIEHQPDLLPHLRLLKKLFLIYRAAEGVVDVLVLQRLQEVIDDLRF